MGLLQFLQDGEGDEAYPQRQQRHRRRRKVGQAVRHGAPPFLRHTPSIFARFCGDDVFAAHPDTGEPLYMQQVIGFIIPIPRDLAISGTVNAIRSIGCLLSQNNTNLCFLILFVVAYLGRLAEKNFSSALLAGPTTGHTVLVASLTVNCLLPVILRLKDCADMFN